MRKHWLDTMEKGLTKEIGGIEVKKSEESFPFGTGWEDIFQTKKISHLFSIFYLLGFVLWIEVCNEIA